MTARRVGASARRRGFTSAALPAPESELDCAALDHPVHPQVKKLLDLQQLDQKIALIVKDIESLPAETARRQRQLDLKRAESAARDKAFVDAEVQIRGLELSTRQGDDEVKKLDGRLSSVRNNAEYQATLLQIESVKRERDRAQEEALGLMEKLEGLVAARDEGRAALQAEEATFAEFQEEAAKLRAAREAEAAKIAIGREKLLEGVPADLLGKYTKLFKSRQRMAVAGVEGQVCQGCYNRITVNDVARLRGGATVVECGSCNRILYLHDDA